MSKNCAVCDSLKEKVKDLEFVLGLYHEKLNALIDACETYEYTYSCSDAIEDAKAIMPKI